MDHNSRFSSYELRSLGMNLGNLENYFGSLLCHHFVDSKDPLALPRSLSKELIFALLSPTKFEDLNSFEIQTLNTI